MTGERAGSGREGQALPNFEASLAYEMLNFLGPDAAEGLAALQEKRRPDFRTGQ